MNAVLMRVIQESLVAVSTVAIKAVLADASATQIVKAGGTAVCSCGKCED